MNFKKLIDNTQWKRTSIKYQHITGRTGMKNECNVYPWYRLDQNISWFNIGTFIGGLLYGLITLKIFKKEYGYLRRSGKFWLPPKWDIKEE